MKNFIKRNLGFFIVLTVTLLYAIFGESPQIIFLILVIVTAILAIQTDNIMKNVEISDDLEEKHFDLTIIDTGFHMHYNLFNFEYKKGDSFIKIPTKDIRQIHFNGYKKHKSNQIIILYMNNEKFKRVIIEADELKDVFFTIYLPSMCKHEAKSNKHKPTIQQSTTIY